MSSSVGMAVPWVGIILLLLVATAVIGALVLGVFFIMKLIRGSKSCANTDQTVQELNRKAEDMSQRLESLETVVMEKDD